MAGLSRIASAAILVVHMTVGCCAHHAHAWAGLGCLLHNQVSGPAHSRGPDVSCGRVDDARPGPQDCREGSCSAVSAEPTISDSIDQSSLARPPVCDLSGQVAIMSEQRLFAAGQLLLPTRLHLVNHVLLI
jgi:hypothetical protein